MDNYISRQEHNEFVRRMEDEHKRINIRLSNHDKSTEQLQGLVTAVGKMAVNMENMVAEIHSQGERLQRFEDEPREAVGTFRRSVLSSIGSAVGTAVILGLAVFIYFSMKG